jgi:hypothetical protein
MTLERPMFPPTRRAFINTIAALPIAAAAPAAAARTLDAELIELGAQFEPLLDEYYAAHEIWSRGGKDPGGNWAKLSALSKAINKLPASSVTGLRAKALVAFWEVAPLCAGDTEFSFEDAYPFQQLFTAVAEFCGLKDKMVATGYELPDIAMVDDDSGDDSDDEREEA